MYFNVGGNIHQHISTGMDIMTVAITTIFGVNIVTTFLQCLVESSSNRLQYTCISYTTVLRCIWVLYVRVTRARSVV